MTQKGFVFALLTMCTFFVQDSVSIFTPLTRAELLEAVGKCAERNSTFYSCTANGTRIESWNVGLVTDMRFLFRGHTQFNADLSGWDVSRSTSLLHMFESAESFNSDLSRWNVSSVQHFGWAFQNARSFNSNLLHWNLQSVSNIDSPND